MYSLHQIVGSDIFWFKYYMFLQAFLIEVLLN